ncbi:hypothetical protein KFK09_000853 [Dendrobium nobile]|uniref:Uncharacterized protein n=1 Tax=Dendrobium nobile TaxID=94219 RepID=A0A8T3CG43_DENNO|nr:hypothetical protein KFK09_000853 [Dendrobium nobile]
MALGESRIYFAHIELYYDVALHHFTSIEFHCDAYGEVERGGSKQESKREIGDRSCSLLLDHCLSSAGPPLKALTSAGPPPDVVAPPDYHLRS